MRFSAGGTKLLVTIGVVLAGLIGAREARAGGPPVPSVTTPQPAPVSTPTVSAPSVPSAPASASVPAAPASVPATPAPSRSTAPKAPAAPSVTAPKSQPPAVAPVTKTPVRVPAARPQAPKLSPQPAPHVQGGQAVVGTVQKTVGGIQGTAKKAVVLAAPVARAAKKAVGSAAPVARAVKTPTDRVTSVATGLAGGTPAGALVAGTRSVAPLGSADVLPSMTSSQGGPSSQSRSLRGNNNAPASSREWNTAALGASGEAESLGGEEPPAQVLDSPLVTIERVQATSLALLLRPRLDTFFGSSVDLAGAPASTPAQTSHQGGGSAPREPVPMSPAPSHGVLGGVGGGGAIFLLLLASLAGAFLWAVPRLGRWLRPIPDLVQLHYPSALDSPG